MFTIFNNRVFFLDERNKVVEQVFFEGDKCLHLYAVQNVS